MGCYWEALFQMMFKALSVGKFHTCVTNRLIKLCLSEQKVQTWELETNHPTQ